MTYDSSIGKSFCICFSFLWSNLGNVPRVGGNAVMKCVNKNVLFHNYLTYQMFGSLNGVSLRSCRNYFHEEKQMTFRNPDFRLIFEGQTQSRLSQIYCNHFTSALYADAKYPLECQLRFLFITRSTQFRA